MTAILEALQALAALPNPRPDRPVFLAHPAHAEAPEGLALLRSMQANGVDVRIMRDVRAPAVPLDEWLTPEPRAAYRHSTFAELDAQARRLRYEALQAEQGLPDFIVTREELDELMRANGWSELPAGATFHGMKLRAVLP